MKRSRDAFFQGEDYDDFVFSQTKAPPMAPPVPTDVPTALVSPPVPAALVPTAVPALVPTAVPQVPPAKFVAPPGFLNDALRDDAFGAIDLWIRKPSLPSSQRPLLIIGPTGSGKTRIIKNSGPVEMYDDQDIEDFLSPHGLRVRQACVIKTIESLDASERSHVKKALTSGRRIIMTSEDAFAEPTKTWSKLCTVVRLERPSVQFIQKVLRQFTTDEPAIQYIAEMCNGNLASAVNSMQWCTKYHNSNVRGSDMTVDMPIDVPRATTMLLTGKPVACIGGSGDISFLNQLLQINVPQSPSSIQDLCKTLENYSFNDVIESYHELDNESLWTLVDTTARQGPKLKALRFEWPKSTKRSENPKYTFA